MEELYFVSVVAGLDKMQMQIQMEGTNRSVRPDKATSVPGKTGCNVNTHLWGLLHMPPCERSSLIFIFIFSFSFLSSKFNYLIPIVNFGHPLKFLFNWFHLEGLDLSGLIQSHMP